jgi:RNA polymerase sigma-70 factor (ECF subfamily)
VARFIAAVGRWLWDGAIVIPVTANGRAGVLIVRDSADFALLTIGGSQREIDRILWVMNPVKLASIALAAHTAHEPSTRDACS